LPSATKPYRRLRVQFTAQKGILQANSAKAAGAGILQADSAEADGAGILQANSAKAAGAGCFAWLGSKQ